MYNAGSLIRNNNTKLRTSRLNPLIFVNPKRFSNGAPVWSHRAHHKQPARKLFQGNQRAHILRNVAGGDLFRISNAKWFQYLPLHLPVWANIFQKSDTSNRIVYMYFKWRTFTSDAASWNKKCSKNEQFQTCR